MDQPDCLQVFAALQYVVEEKYVKHYRMPASLAVGLEGFWGLVLSCILLPLFQNIPVRLQPAMIAQRRFEPSRT